MTKIHSRAASWALAGLAAAMLLAGCAVQQHSGGTVSVGIDDAELFGQTVAQFKLADGSDGRLRLHQGRYSIKLQRYFKVIPVDRAQAARLVSAQVLDGRSVLVLEKGAPGCPFQTQVMAIEGSEVLSWDLGDCRNAPQIQVSGGEMAFDFPQGQRLVRYIYRDRRLLRAEAQLPSAGPGQALASGLPERSGMPPSMNQTSAAGTGNGMPRHVPGLPHPVSVSQPQASASAASSPVALAQTAASATAGSATAQAAKPAAKPAAAPQPGPAPAPRQAAAPVFTTQEQKPIRIVLDK
ncbi:MAG: hypothetical protein E6Q92_02445 [Burkholderiaceae bacterium]|nr:MAG: hypothetical protein E6Q92_02445 [Burkholderiaceae bacterium]